MDTITDQNIGYMNDQRVSVGRWICKELNLQGKENSRKDLAIREFARNGIIQEIKNLSCKEHNLQGNEFAGNWISK